jgi:YidC/Oxa1 family membrane protein insertase
MYGPVCLQISAIIPLNSQFLWMDLGSPERLVLPFLPFGIPVLALVVMASTYVQSKLMQQPTMGSGGDQAAMMGKMMNMYMPFLMGYLALTLASGLALYFLGLECGWYFTIRFDGESKLEQFVTRSQTCKCKIAGRA